MDSKFPEQSKTIQTDFVLPADTNSLNNLFGGELLARMDKVASIAAIKHSEQIVVTASINNVAFGEPVPNGSILTIEAKVSRAFNSSMEVFIDVWKQNKTDKKKVKVNEAIYTFVAVNKRGKWGTGSERPTRTCSPRSFAAWHRSTGATRSSRPSTRSSRR